EGGSFPVRSVLTESGNGDEDDSAIQRGEALVVETHGAHDTRPEVLEHDVGLGHERGEDVLTLGAAEVGADALLAPVVHGEVDALPADDGRVLARLLAAWRLDLDHPAPRSDRSMPPRGPAWKRASSRTRMPSRQPGMREG